MLPLSGWFPEPGNASKMRYNCPWRETRDDSLAGRVISITLVLISGLNDDIAEAVPSRMEVTVGSLMERRTTRGVEVLGKETLF
jgi:hypothetical protein